MSEELYSPSLECNIINSAFILHYKYLFLLRNINRIGIFYMRPEAFVFSSNAARVSQMVGHPCSRSSYWKFYLIIQKYHLSNNSIVKNNVWHYSSKLQTAYRDLKKFHFFLQFPLVCLQNEKCFSFERTTAVLMITIYVLYLISH